MLQHVAIHEAGHAVVGVVLGFDLDHVSIDERGAGVTVWREGGEDESGVDDDADPDPPACAARVDAVREDPDRFDAVLRWSSSPRRDS